MFDFQPIGYINSPYKEKNGTPRQSLLSNNPTAAGAATLEISHEHFTNPHHSLDGLGAYSHVWIIFVFHKNDGHFAGAKVRPPRLGGRKIGVFACRTPHRPNAIGLSLVRLLSVKGATLHLSDVDMIDGTPVLDVKPFIPLVDCPFHYLFPHHDATVNCQQMQDSNTLSRPVCDLSKSKVEAPNSPVVGNESKDNAPFEFERITLEKDDLSGRLASVGCETLDENFTFDHTASASIPEWVSSPSPPLDVRFTPTAEVQLANFHSEKQIENGANCKGDTTDKEMFRLEHFDTFTDCRSAIAKTLANDPRSIYRKLKCKDRLYYFCIDSCHVTCWFDEDDRFVEVVRIQPRKVCSFLSKDVDPEQNLNTDT